MAESIDKQEKMKQNDTKPYLVTLVIVLSEDEQINAAKLKASEFNAATPDKLQAIGKPSSTK